MSIDTPLNTLLEAITKRNPGATRVFFELLHHFEEASLLDFADLLEMQIVGSDLWDLYKACGQNIEVIHTAIMQKTAMDMLKAIPGTSFWQQAQKG